MCRGAGLEPSALNGMTYNPLTRAYALARDTGVNYILHARR
jgi:2-polyprenyl-6-hydroxyphenyl methylase/3-demethylubiquinone-9 3-methyltransferase